MPGTVKGRTSPSFIEEKSLGPAKAQRHELTMHIHGVTCNWQSLEFNV